MVRSTVPRSSTVVTWREAPSGPGVSTSTFLSTSRGAPGVMLRDAPPASRSDSVVDFVVVLPSGDFVCSETVCSTRKNLGWSVSCGSRRVVVTSLVSLPPSVVVRSCLTS